MSQKMLYKKGTRAMFEALGCEWTGSFCKFLYENCGRPGFCTRCGGQGYSSHPSWAAHDGGQCFKCNGSGRLAITIPKSLAAKIAKAWKAHQAVSA